MLGLKAWTTQPTKIEFVDLALSDQRSFPKTLGVCYFSIVVIRNSDEGHLYNKEFIGGFTISEGKSMIV